MCTGRPVRIGGWDIALRRPKPRLAYMPVGTVYYFTTRHSGAEVVEALHDRKIGFDTKIGFGHIVVGRW
jgi:CRISPR-associated protein Cmr3